MFNPSRRHGGRPVLWRVPVFAKFCILPPSDVLDPWLH
jgi:hypothetical protein